jgi:outer membrane lipoprotein LolB
MLAALLGLTGCKSLAPEPAGGPAAVSGSSTPAWTSERSGRVSLTAEDDRGNPTRWQATFLLKLGTDDRLQLDLIDPLGNTQARIRSRSDGAEVETPKDGVLRYPDLASLTQHIAGVALPASAWRFWLRGEPDPALPASRAEQSGQSVIEQAGFSIRIARTRADGSPALLVLTRADRPNLNVRIVLDD